MKAKPQDPNELRGDPIEAPEETDCVRCGMAKEDWKGNKGNGVKQEGEMYCCKGCAEDTGCTCKETEDD